MFLITDFGLNERALDVVLQPDGKIIAAGVSGQGFRTRTSYSRQSEEPHA